MDLMSDRLFRVSGVFAPSLREASEAFSPKAGTKASLLVAAPNESEALRRVSCPEAIKLKATPWDRPAPTLTEHELELARLALGRLESLRRTGLPALEGLQSLADSMGPSSVRWALTVVIKAVEEGTELPEALGWFPQIFPPTVTLALSGNAEESKHGSVAIAQHLDLLELRHEHAREIRRGMKFFVAHSILVVIFVVSLGGIIGRRFTKNVEPLQYRPTEGLEQTLQSMMSAAAQLPEEGMILDVLWVVALLIPLAILFALRDDWLSHHRGFRPLGLIGRLLQPWPVHEQDQHALSWHLARLHRSGNLNAENLAKLLPIATSSQVHGALREVLRLVSEEGQEPAQALADIGFDIEITLAAKVAQGGGDFAASLEAFQPLFLARFKEAPNRGARIQAGLILLSGLLVGSVVCVYHLSHSLNLLNAIGL